MGLSYYFPAVDDVYSVCGAARRGVFELAAGEVVCLWDGGGAAAFVVECGDGGLAVCHAECCV